MGDNINANLQLMRDWMQIPGVPDELSKELGQLLADRKSVV
jgi:hypothetical protein